MCWIRTALLGYRNSLCHHELFANSLRSTLVVLQPDIVSRTLKFRSLVAVCAVLLMPGAKHKRLQLLGGTQYEAALCFIYLSTLASNLVLEKSRAARISKVKS